MDWSKEKIIQLIDLYHDQPLLWNPKHADHKDRNKKNDAWEFISTALNHNQGDIEIKIKNLTTQFYREQKKSKSGDGTDDVTVSKWFALKSMMFLKDKNKPNCTKEAGILDYEDTTDTEDKGQNDIETEKSIDENSVNQNLLENTQEKLHPRKLFKSPKKLNEKQKKKNDNHMVEEAYQVMKTLTSQPQKDEYNIFGEHVGNKIRKLPTNYSKNTVQYLINNILYEAELGKYNEPPSNQSLYYNYSSTLPSYCSQKSLLANSNDSKSNLSSSEIQLLPNNNDIPNSPSISQVNSSISNFLTIPESSENGLDTLILY